MGLIRRRVVSYLWPSPTQQWPNLSFPAGAIGTLLAFRLNLPRNRHSRGWPQLTRKNLSKAVNFWPIGCPKAVPFLLLHGEYPILSSPRFAFNGSALKLGFCGATRTTQMAPSLLLAALMDFGIVGLLRIAWVAGTLPLLIASLPFPCLDRFRGVLSGFAGRGKIMHVSASRKFSVPQRFFAHFYIVGVLWTTLLLVATWAYANNTAPLSSEPSIYSNIASHLTGGPFSWHRASSTSLKHRYAVWNSVYLLLLMEIQVSRRLYETIYVFNYGPSARMHIVGYLTGLFFYTAAPLSLCCNFALDVYNFSASQVSEFIIRGKDQFPPIVVDFWEITSPLLKLRWRHWIGAGLVLWGWVHQRRCHAILGSLRKRPEQSDEYVIPCGDWFENVSCPHYLAEMVVYAGLVVASGGMDLTIWLLFVFVVANLLLAGAETHQWYHRKFDSYPKNRYAIIPFLY